MGKTVADTCGERRLAREKKRVKTTTESGAVAKTCDSMGARVTNGANMARGKWRENMMHGATDGECGESERKNGANDGECGESMGVCVTHGGKTHDGKDMG